VVVGWRDERTRNLSQGKRSGRRIRRLTQYLLDKLEMILENGRKIEAATLMLRSGRGAIHPCARDSLNDLYTKEKKSSE